MLTMDEIEDSQQAGLCCTECATTNPPQRKFCSKCGTPLWEPCFRCGDLCAVGETYCGACGANVSEMSAEQVELARADLCTAVEMKLAFRFEEAIALLSRISKKEHPRLAEHAARARELISQVAAERRQQQIAVEQACERTRQCLAVFDYDVAAQIIENVPLPLQNDDVKSLRTQITGQQREIDTLTEELHNTVHQNRLLELLPRVERLLSLKPNHAFAKSVAERVQKRLVVAAKKMLAEHRYDQAMRLLDQIPVPMDGADFQRLRRQTAELAWLDWDLRNAPVIDDTLVAVAERLRQLAPNNAHTIRLCNELQRRNRLAKGEQNQQPQQWAHPPKKTPLGVPVEWLTRFRRIACSEKLDRSELLRHPGRFYIACGLALAGIKQAALRINFLPARQQGGLHRIMHLMRPQIAKSAWGIDLGTSSLKAIKLVWDEAKQQAVIESAVLIEHAKSLNHAANEAEEGKVIAETLAAFLNGREIQTESVSVGLPVRITLSRQVNVPPVGSAKVMKLIQFEAAHQFPLPLEQLVWDFQLLDDPPALDSVTEASNKKGCRALMIAAKRTVIHHFLEIFQRLDMRVDVLQPDFIALHNFLSHDYFTAASDPSLCKPYPVVAALDIGCDVTNIVVSSPHSLWFRSCGVAGHSFTRALVKEFNLTVAQAEQRKRTPESTERFSDFYGALSPEFDDLLNEVQQSLTAYAQAQPVRLIDHVVAVGGGFSLHGLFRHLRCGR